MAHARRFRFGVHSSKAVDGPAWVDAARRYEDLGFSSLLPADHFDDQFAPIAAMTAAACATTSLRVGCLVFDNDYRHPLVLAKEMATLDVLSGGRVEVGIGAGWMGSDYEQAGMPYDRPGVRVSRLIEAVRIMKALFGDGAVSIEGEHYTITDHDALPKPVQRPHPPILIGGGNERMLKHAGREADIIGLAPAFVSNEAWAETNVADGTQEATDRKLTWIRDAAGERFDQIELSINLWIVIPTDDRGELAASIAAGLDISDEAGPATAARVLASPYVLLGTIDEMAETLEERRERWGISYYVFNDDVVDASASLVARLAGT
jgi:probable F420-dependent oxidoreductase